MWAWIGAGIAGWLVSLLPLVGVNVAAYNGLFGYEVPATAGAFALLGGILLGGLVTGLIAGRKGQGLRAAAVSGGCAALLYVGSVIALVYGTGYLDAAQALIAAHPERLAIAVVFCGALLFAVAFLVGAFTGRSAGISSVLPRPQRSAPTRMPSSPPRPATPPPPSRPTRAPHPSTLSGAGRYPPPPFDRPGAADPDADALYAASRRESSRSVPFQRGRGPSGRRDGGRQR